MSEQQEETDLRILEELLVWNDGEFRHFSFENREESENVGGELLKDVIIEGVNDDVDKKDTEEENYFDERKILHYAEKIDKEKNVILISGQNVTLEISQEMLRSWEDALSKSHPSTEEIAKHL